MLTVNSRNVALLTAMISTWARSRRHECGKQGTPPTPPAVFTHVVAASSIVTLSPGRMAAAQSSAQAVRPASSASTTTRGSSTAEPLLLTSTVILRRACIGINVLVLLLVYCEVSTPLRLNFNSR